MYQVMIVDDEQMVINSLVLGFDWRAHGYEVVATTTNSSEALDMIRFIRPDVVFSDVKMPSLSGLDLMRKVRQELAQVQFVFISGYADFSYVQTALSLGAAGYCLKPLEEEEITQVLENVTKHLNAQQEALQVNFNHLLRSPCEQTAQALLDKLYPNCEIPQNLTAAVSVGRANWLLSGNVSYAFIAMSNKAYLYLISSNREYLSSVPFCTALLNAAAEKKINSFAWCNIPNAVAFLHTELAALLNSAYLYFTKNSATLGRAHIAVNLTENEIILQASARANKNRIIELLDLLEQIKKGCHKIIPKDAFELYNICAALLKRMGDEGCIAPLASICELAEAYNNIDDMLAALIRRFEVLTGSVDPENLRNDTFKKVLDYVNHNFTTQLSFQDICTDYCINASYLSQLFKKEIGITFTSYITNLRLQYAKELLETTPLRISEITEKIGYGFDYNFTKLFKKETGLTPREYREQVRKNEKQ